MALAAVARGLDRDGRLGLMTELLIASRYAADDSIRDSGETLNHLAGRTGVDRARVSRFMRGERGLSLESVEAICEALGLQLTSGRPRKPKEKGKGPGQSLFDAS